MCFLTLIADIYMLDFIRLYYYLLFAIPESVSQTDWIKLTIENEMFQEIGWNNLIETNIKCLDILHTWLRAS